MHMLHSTFAWALLGAVILPNISSRTKCKAADVLSIHTIHFPPSCFSLFTLFIQDFIFSFVLLMDCTAFRIKLACIYNLISPL